MGGETLKDALPHEFLIEYQDTRAYRMKDVKIVAEYGNIDGYENKAWPGIHKNVYYWVELENGYAVAWNENPARGWSFPVVKIKKLDRREVL